MYQQYIKTKFLYSDVYCGWIWWAVTSKTQFFFKKLTEYLVRSFKP